MYFPVNFAKFLRTPSLQNTSERLLLFSVILETVLLLPIFFFLLFFFFDLIKNKPFLV